MIDAIYWETRLCDLCLEDERELEPRLVGVMENGRWVGGYTPQKAEKARVIRAAWEVEITRPCLVIKADMEEVVICEKHLIEATALKDSMKSPQMFDAESIIRLLQEVPPETPVRFLCPDGFEDAFFNYEKQEDGGILFKGYKSVK